MRRRRDEISPTFAGLVRKRESVIKRVSRSCLIQNFCRAHGLALSCDELLPGLLDRGCHSLAPALRETAIEHSYQLCLRVGIKLFSRVENIGKCCLLTHVEPCRKER